MLEKFLLENAIPITGTIVVLVVCYAKFKAKIDEADSCGKQLEEHKRDPVPHGTCIEHTTMLKNIEQTINRIDERVYLLYKSNGHTHDDKV